MGSSDVSSSETGLVVSSLLVAKTGHIIATSETWLCRGGGGDVAMTTGREWRRQEGSGSGSVASRGGDGRNEHRGKLV
jgi:hypothetical protein